MLSPSMRVAAVAIALALVPAGAAADKAFGVGVRMAMIKADTNAGADADRFTGGLLRAHLSTRTALELSVDWRTVTNQALTERVRDLPVQGSLLLYPFRRTFAPYVLGGVGWYSQRIQTLSESTVTSTVTSRDFGSHVGFGGELRLGRRAAVHLDYRYTRVRSRDDEEKAEEARGGGFRVPVLAPLAGRLNLTHDGSMWTGGLTFYF